MISTWTIAPTGGATCGYDGARIPEGDPVELLARGGLDRKLVRCVVHAHTPVDQDAVSAARRAALARQQPPAEPEPSLANARPTYARHTLRRPPTPFAKLDTLGAATFDPKAAAANDPD